MQVQEALRQARQALEPVSDSAPTEARVLLADTLGTTTSWLVAHDREDLTSAAEAAFDLRVRRCAAGEPLPYILGWWEFYGRRFTVNRDVLIPRPETELLVEHALAEVRRRDGQARIVDVGTGSGCVAVTLAAEIPSCRVAATDISRAALEVALANAAAHSVAPRVDLVLTSLLDGLAGGWDVICANLPYLPRDRLAHLPVAQHEPLVALDGGLRGIEYLVKLIESLKSCLSSDGVALMEVDEGQAEELARVVPRALGKATVTIIPDLAHRERLLSIRRGHHEP